MNFSWNADVAVDPLPRLGSTRCASFLATHRRGLVGSLVGLVLTMLSACSVGQAISESEAEHRAASNAPNADDARSIATADAENDDDQALPLAEYFGWSTDEERLVTAQAEASEFLASCMAEEGFEFYPPPAVISDESEREAMAGVIDSPEWVSIYGFGISTQAFSQEEVGPNLTGREEVQANPRSDRPDANSAYFDGLTAEEKEAYVAALSLPGGCGQRADARMLDSLRDDVFLEEFRDDMIDLEERIRADPRIVSYENALAECVKSRGFDFHDLDSARKEIQAEVSELIAATEAGISSGLSTESEVVVDEQLVLSGPQLEELERIQKDEVDLAVAVFECGGSDQAFAEIYEELRVEYELRFIEANRDRLEAVRRDSES